ERLGHEALAGVGLVDPVADVAALERAPLDDREVDLADEAALHEDAVRVPGAELALALAGAAPDGEGVAALHRVRRAGRALGLPHEQPLGVAAAHLLPRREVLQREGTERHAPA